MVTAIGECEYEVVKGRRFAKTSGARHGGVCIQVIAELGDYLNRHKIGRIYSPDTTFLIGDEERLPDVSFISSARIPAEGAPLGRWEIAPDLAVEVISPDDIYDIIITKLYDYFAAGVREVWLIEPTPKTVTVYSSPKHSRTLIESDELTSDLLPGFSCRVRNFFQI